MIIRILSDLFNMPNIEIQLSNLYDYDTKAWKSNEGKANLDIIGLLFT